VPFSVYRITKNWKFFFTYVFYLFSVYLVCIHNMIDWEKKLLHYCASLYSIWWHKIHENKCNVLKNEVWLWSESCICFCVMGRSVQSVVIPLSSLKIFILKHTKLLCCLYECETLASTLWAQHRLSVSKSRVLRKIHGSEREKVTGAGENCIMRSLMICTAHNILLKVKLFCYMPRRLWGEVEVSCIHTQPQC